MDRESERQDYEREQARHEKEEDRLRRGKAGQGGSRETVAPVKAVPCPPCPGPRDYPGDSPPKAIRRGKHPRLDDSPETPDSSDGQGELPFGGDSKDSLRVELSEGRFRSRF